MTDYLRKIFKNLLHSVARFFHGVGIKPNTITFLGVVGNFIAAYFISIGNLRVGGWIVLLMGPIDAIDGALARYENEDTKFGAFLDSVSDRYSELAIIFGLLIFSLDHSNEFGIVLSYLAAAGSLMVSYVRARAESLNTDCKIGVLTRVERYLVIVPTLLFNWVNTGLLIIATLSHLTALQRIFFIRKELLK